METNLPGIPKTPKFEERGTRSKRFGLRGVSQDMSGNPSKCERFSITVRDRRTVMSVQ